MKSIGLENMGTRARFMPFFIMLAILGILLIGSFITPLRLVLDNVFENFEDNAINNGDPKLSCTNSDSYWYIKSTCFTLGGFMVIFVLYILYQWVTAMTNGSKKNGPVFAPRYRKIQAALQQ